MLNKPDSPRETLSSNNVKLGDGSVRVPKLELGGSNWVLYKDRLLWAADAKGYRNHLDGTVTEPVAPQAQAATAETAAEGAGLLTPGQGRSRTRAHLLSENQSFPSITDLTRDWFGSQP